MLFLAMVTKTASSYDDLTALDALGAFNEQREIDEYLERNNLPLPETHILREELDWVCASVYDGLNGFLKDQSRNEVRWYHGCHRCTVLC
jgi:hypothetical protein